MYRTRVTDGAGESENEASSSICEKKKHTPSETNTSLHGHSLHNTTHDAPGAHLTLEALGVDAEVAGRALAVVGGGEAGELFHRPPRRRVVVARGGADAEEEREDDEARRGGRLRRHDASFFRWLLCWVGFDGELGTGGYFVRGAREIWTAGGGGRSGRRRDGTSHWCCWSVWWWWPDCCCVLTRKTTRRRGGCFLTITRILRHVRIAKAQQIFNGIILFVFNNFYLIIV